MSAMFDLFARRAGDIAWSPVMLALLLGSGVWFTFRTGFIQVTRVREVLRATVGSLFGGRRQKNAAGPNITPFQAVSTALAGTMGVGNITGIAAAITLGGPGAVFWMWVSAFFGMATKYAEVLLAVRFRRKTSRGGHLGGPMYYIEEGLRCRPLAVLFCLLCAAASFGIGNMAQTNAVAGAAEASFGLPPWATGAAMTLAAALVILGGVTRVGRVTELLIPAFSVLYILAAVLILLLRFERIPEAFRSIFSGAFGAAPVLGGAAGYTLSQAVRYGVSRGIFSNEAGLGSSPIAYAASDSSDAAGQGMWGIFEVFVDTMLVCTLTTLVILTSGAADEGYTGAGMSAQAFSLVLGPWGGRFIALALGFFALASLLGWAVYGERCLEYLFPGGVFSKRLYRLLYLGAAFLGSVMRLEAVWNLSDLFNALMAVPNLLAVLTLSDMVAAATEEYFGARRPAAKRNKRRGKKLRQG